MRHPPNTDASSPFDVLDPLTSKRFLSYFILFAIGLALPMLLIFRHGPPLPQIQDEFSYLLMADTFINGRLSNPPHQLANFLETFHVLVEPTYSSKYFPLIGMVLSIGMVIGHPIFGIWILCGMLGCVLYYAAQSLLPRNLAWVTALVFLLQFGVLNYWTYQYWSGLPFCLSGLLVMGGMFNQLKGPRLAHGIITGLGLMGILLSRPLEGFFFCLPFACLTVFLILGKPGLSRVLYLTMPQALLSCAAIGFLGAYNNSVTGSAFQFPHSAFQERYFPDMKRLPWDDTESIQDIDRPPRFDQYKLLFDELRPSNVSELWAKHSAYQKDWLAFYFPFFVLIMLGFCLVGTPGKQHMIFWTLVSLPVLRLLILVVSASVRHTHYTAAWVAMSLGIFSYGISRAHRLMGGRNTQLFIAFILALQSYQYISGYFTDWDPGYKLYTTYSDYKFGRDRKEIEDRVSADKDFKHVIIVRYAQNHNIEVEWVYNGANIDEQRVVWLAWRGEDSLRAIKDYYPDRKIWLLESPGVPNKSSLGLVYAPDSPVHAP